MRHRNFELSGMNKYPVISRRYRHGFQVDVQRMERKGFPEGRIIIAGILYEKWHLADDAVYGIGIEKHVSDAAPERGDCENLSNRRWQ